MRQSMERIEVCGKNKSLILTSEHNTQIQLEIAASCYHVTYQPTSTRRRWWITRTAPTISPTTSIPSSTTRWWTKSTISTNTSTPSSTTRWWTRSTISKTTSKPFSTSRWWARKTTSTPSSTTRWWTSSITSTTLTPSSTTRWWTSSITSTTSTPSSTTRWWTSSITSTTLTTASTAQWGIANTVSTTSTTPSMQQWIYTSPMLNRSHSTSSRQILTEVVYERYIMVNCQESNWYIRLYIRELQNMFPDFNTRDVYLGNDGCTGYQSGDYLIFNEDYNSCQTTKSTTNDVVIYRNTLVYALHDPNHKFIVREYRFKVKVECDMSKREPGANNIQHNHGRYEDHTASGFGHFTIDLKFFSDSNYQNEFSGYPPSYMIGDNVYVKVQTNTHDYDLKMRVSECYTKPSEYSSNSYIYYLIKHGCPDDPNTFITSQSIHETRFYFQDFEYAGHPDSMYVHCNATFCRTDDYSDECEPRCKGRKRARNINQNNSSTNVDFADDGLTIRFNLDQGKSPENLSYDQTNPDLTDSTSYLVGIVFVCVGFVVVLWAAIMIFIKRKWKKEETVSPGDERRQTESVI